MSIAVVVDNDLQRAQARFVAAYQRGMKETAVEAQFLAGKGMSNREIGALVGHGEGWVRAIRKWAADGFNGAPTAHTASKRNNSSNSTNESLKNNDNSDQDEETEKEEAQAKDDGPEFLLTCAGQADHRAQLFLRHMPEVQLSEGQARQILDFIHKAMAKWDTVKRKLEKAHHG